MSNEQERKQASELLDNFNQVSEQTQDKIVSGVKYLAFLYGLADTKDDDAPTAQSTTV